MSTISAMILQLHLSMETYISMEFIWIVCWLRGFKSTPFSILPMVSLNEASSITHLMLWSLSIICSYLKASSKLCIWDFSSLSNVVILHTPLGATHNPPFANSRTFLLSWGLFLFGLSTPRSQIAWPKNTKHLLQDYPNSFRGWHVQSRTERPSSRQDTYLEKMSHHCRTLCSPCGTMLCMVAQEW